MEFVNDYKNAGGALRLGRCGFYLQGVWFRLHPRAGDATGRFIGGNPAATRNGAEVLGMEDEIGAISGKKGRYHRRGQPSIKLQIVYGTGHRKLNRETGVIERVGGVSYTVKDGVVYDAKAPLADVRAMVKRAKTEPATTE